MGGQKGGKCVGGMTSQSSTDRNISQSGGALYSPLRLHLMTFQGEKNRCLTNLGLAQAMLDFQQNCGTLEKW